MIHRLLQKGINLLRDITSILMLKMDAFDENTVEKEKRNLKQRIQSVYDDKMRYSSLRLVEEMCKGEPYAIQVNGELEQVDDITARNLYTNIMRRHLAEDELDLYMIGDVDVKEVEGFCGSIFNLKTEIPKAISNAT